MSNNMKTCLFVGTFDPFHNGHLEMVKNLSKHYDIVYIFITKHYLKFRRMFKTSEMINAINLTLKENNITNAMCVDLSHFIPCTMVNEILQCNEFVRGQKDTNSLLEKVLTFAHNSAGLKTITHKTDVVLSSRKIKAMYKENKDISNLVPKPIYDLFTKTQEKEEFNR